MDDLPTGQKLTTHTSRLEETVLRWRPIKEKPDHRVKLPVRLIFIVQWPNGGKELAVYHLHHFSGWPPVWEGQGVGTYWAFLPSQDEMP